MRQPGRVAENDRALTQFALLWSDVMELRIVPVLADAELAEVLVA